MQRDAERSRHQHSKRLDMLSPKPPLSPSQHSTHKPTQQIALFHEAIALLTQQLALLCEAIALLTQQLTLLREAIALLTQQLTLLREAIALHPVQHPLLPK